MIDKEIHDRFIKEKIDAPESKHKHKETVVRKGALNEWADYSTDELFRILPREIDGYSLVTWGNYCGYASIFINRPLLKWIQNIPFKEINQALKQLLKWVLDNHPELLREHLNKLEV